MRHRFVIDLNSDEDLDLEIIEEITKRRKGSRRNEFIRSLVRAGFSITVQKTDSNQALINSLEPEALGTILRAFAGGLQAQQPISMPSDYRIQPHSLDLHREGAQQPRESASHEITSAPSGSQIKETSEDNQLKMHHDNPPESAAEYRSPSAADYQSENTHEPKKEEDKDADLLDMDPSILSVDSEHEDLSDLKDPMLKLADIFR